jgi:DNA-binding transcriptional LysR family regulator
LRRIFYRTTTGYLPTAHGKNMMANAETKERAAVVVAARAREGSGAVAGRVRLAMLGFAAGEIALARADQYL